MDKNTSDHLATYYSPNTHFHFVGIGGIGMSGLALLLAQRGYKVSGCDIDITQQTIPHLKQLGCTVYKGNNSPECNDLSINVLIYIPMYAETISAVSKEIFFARQHNITILSRAQLLAQFMEQKYSITVTGSHGKTTTTSLISHIFITANTNPTVIIGGQLKNISSNAYNGNGSFVIAEADESDRSFLALKPDIAVITNIDKEHLETYKDLSDILNTYMQFIDNISPNGKAIMCIDDDNSRSIQHKIQRKTISYGIDNDADIKAINIQLFPTYSVFTLQQKNNQQNDIILSIPGKHNIYNALAAIAVALENNIDLKTIIKSLSNFAGIERRFSFHGIYKNAEVFDDYGHHPQEIKNILLVARQRAKNKLIIIFQPHRYTRTEKLWDDFISVFSTSIIDTLIITDIYSAGEPVIPSITGNHLVSSIQKAHPFITIHYAPYENDFYSIKQLLDQSIQKNDLLLFLGAGKMHLMAKDLIKKEI